MRRMSFVLPSKLFIGLYLLYALASMVLFVQTASGWHGLNFLYFNLVFALPVYLGSLLIFVLIRKRRSESGRVVVYRWLLYPLLLLQTVILIMNTINAPTSFSGYRSLPFQGVLPYVYLATVAALVLTAAWSPISQMQPERERTDTGRSRARPFLPDIFFFLILVAVWLIGRSAAPQIRSWNYTADCRREETRSTNVPVDVCRNSEIFIIAPDGSGLTRLTTERGREFSPLNTQPAWSPDGRRIAFAQGNTVVTIDPDGANRQELTKVNNYLTDLTWSPDSSQLLYAGTGDESSGLFIVRADNAQRLQLVEGGATSAWSSDGKQVLFSINHETDADICVIQATGTGQRCLFSTPGSVSELAWSPDQSHIAFTLEQSDVSAVYLVTTDGSHRQRLASGRASHPQWSPNGQRILVEILPEDRSSARMCHWQQDGTDEQCLETGVWAAAEARWSSDGRRLVFIGGWQNTKALYIVNVNGTERTRVAWNGMISSPAWAPNGQQIVFSG